MRFEDLSGQRFGRLVVLSRAKNAGKHTRWSCLCDCGTATTASSTHLKTGHKASCGCLAAETSAATAKKNAKHGMWKTPEFGVWAGMVKRCHSPTSPGFEKYGAKGIEVCPQWREDFQAFYDHVGPRPDANHSIDRIDGSLGYQPGNVRWATIEEQNNNRSNNVRMLVNGESLTVAQIAKRFGLSHRCVAYRIAQGWPADKVIRPSGRHRKPPTQYVYPVSIPPGEVGTPGAMHEVEEKAA